MKILKSTEINFVSGSGFWNGVGAAIAVYDTYEKVKDMYEKKGVSDKDDPSYAGFGQSYSDLYGKDKER
ncbi:hypothetical protein ACWIVU_10680 [Ursidibacter arcticus]